MTFPHKISKMVQEDPSLDLEKHINSLLSEGVSFGGFSIERESVRIKGGKVIAIYNIVPESSYKHNSLSSE